MEGIIHITYEKYSFYIAVNGNDTIELHQTLPPKYRSYKKYEWTPTTDMNDIFVYGMGTEEEHLLSRGQIIGYILLREDHNKDIFCTETGIIVYKEHNSKVGVELKIGMPPATMTNEMREIGVDILVIDLEKKVATGIKPTPFYNTRAGEKIILPTFPKKMDDRTVKKKFD